MDEENQDPDLQKQSEPMDSDEGPLINENSNGLSHLLTEGEFGGVDASGVDESSASNQGFLNAVELSAGSVGDYLENNSEGFNTDNFDVGDNAVSFPNESVNNLSEDQNDADSLGDPSEPQPVKSMIIISEENTLDSSNELPERKKLKINLNLDDSSVTITSNIESIIDEPDEVIESQMVVEDSPPQIELTEPIEPSEQMQEKILNSLEKSIEQSGGAEETEVVSEDELPTVQKPSVKDAENVSDDELPGPKPAELPADTEVVSEDELPSSKKEQSEKKSRKRKTNEEKDGYDPGSPTSESEAASKKQAVIKNGESKPVPSEKRSSVDEKPKKKTLPELDKYWKVVNDDPTDFTGWTYLLQYVDQESDVEAAREAYDAFLSHYPYCYGYWRKYADYEKRKGSKKKCFEVLERGLKAIPLSVDLWIHYLNHIKSTKGEDHFFIRQQYERAIDACGLEFRSDRLWESYIKWEAEHGSALHVTNIYDRLLATPTLGYTAHFDNFQEHVMSEPVAGAVSHEELVRLRAEVRDGGGAVPTLDLPPGEDEPDDHIASEEEGQAIKEKIIAARRKVHKNTGDQVAQRWTFEEGIKRPYFHVKPLERCQLKNWKAYLEWEKQHGSFRRALVLHERCLIACALYEEFWLRLVKFLEEKSDSDPSLVGVEREVLERACTVHHLDKPALHLHWAYFEEVQGNAARAADILDRIERACPNLVQIGYRRINLERRRGDLEKCVQLYEGYIAAAKSKPIASALAIKYARFLHHIKNDLEGAQRVLDEAVVREPLSARLHLQRLHMALDTPGTPYERLAELAGSYEKQECAELETSVAFAWRQLELAEELGTAEAARAAHAHHRTLARQLRKRTRKDKHDLPPPTPASSLADPKKKDGTASTTSVPPPVPPTNNTYYQAPATPAAPYDQSYQQPYQPPWGYQQPPAPYHQAWPQYPNYY